MRISEEPPKTYFIYTCYACGVHLEPNVNGDRVRTQFGVPQHLHDVPDTGSTTWVTCAVTRVVELNEFTRVQGERDVALATVVSRDRDVKHWEGNTAQQVELKRKLHTKYDRLFRRSLKGRYLRFAKFLKKRVWEAGG